MLGLKLCCMHSSEKHPRPCVLYTHSHRYANNMLVKYNVQCPEGKLPFLVYNKFLLRGECVDNRSVL